MTWLGTRVRLPSPAGMTHSRSPTLRLKAEGVLTL